jgi:hypothetical protein
MKGFKPFPSIGFVLLLCAFMTACGSSHPSNGAAPLNISSTMLPTGVQGIAYNQVLTVTGGVSPYTWTIQGGHLPTGLMLTTGGEITGVVDRNAATTSFTVQVTDSQTPVAAVARQGLSITINPPLGIGTTTLPNGTVNLPYPATALMATGGLAPFSWTVVSGSLPPGLALSTVGQITGTATQVGPFSFSVQASDADGETATAPLTITIVGLLQGSNTFYLNGFNNNQPFYVVGSFVTDGNGNITSGLLDENGSDSVGLVAKASFTGTYAVIPNTVGSTMNNGSLGNMTLNINGIGTRTYGLAFSQDGAVHLIETDQNIWGSGLIQTQVLTGVTLASLGSNSYAYGFAGNDASGKRYAGAGSFPPATPPGNGEEDTNDNGTVSSQVSTTVTFLPTLDTTTGRGTMTIVAGGTTRDYVYYVINPLLAGIAAVQTDAVSTSGSDLAIISPQITGSTGGGGGNVTFGTGSLSASVVLQLNAVTNSAPDESLGVATFDGKGNIARSDGAPGYYLDENQGGNVTDQSCTSGTYSVAANGRVTWSPTANQCTGATVPTSVWYLSNNNRAYVIGADAAVTAGVFEPQSGGGPFNSNSLLPGNLVGGTVTPVLPTQTNELQSTAAFMSGVWSYSYLANGSMNGPVTTPKDINLGWKIDDANNGILGTALGKFDMGLEINNMPVNTQVSYAIEAIPMGNTTQTAQKWVIMDVLIPSADGSSTSPQPNPRLIYLEH